MVYITRGVGREPLVLPPFVGAVSGPRLSLEIDQLILRGGETERERRARGEVHLFHIVCFVHTVPNTLFKH